jgi:polysaccharide deacetylase family protein (PEP-CTERM system associated)
MKTELAFTVDVEDWYHGVELPYTSWEGYEKRLEKGLYPLLELMSEHGARGTFFVLGWVAERYPAIIKRISAADHELGSHGMTHEKVYHLAPDAFRAEVRETKARVEDLSGRPVVAHRSPYFSITARSLWALNILREEGYTLDCSISPVKTWRYGISTSPDTPYYIPEADIVEFPLSTFRLLHKRPAVGGAYFRLLPYYFTRSGIRQRLSTGLPVMFYIHPWEYDPEHPRIPLERKARFTHYTRLSKTLSHTRAMLKEFSFTSAQAALDAYRQRQTLPHVSLERLARG